MNLGEQFELEMQRLRDNPNTDIHFEYFVGGVYVEAEVFFTWLTQE